MIPAPPDLPATTILKVRPGRVVAMHAHPGGKLLFRVLPQTTYGRRLILSVTRRRGAWAAVPTFLVPNGRRAWVRVSRRTFVVRRTLWRLTADLSSRTVTVVHGAERVRRLHVTIGAPATPTPPGTYAVTDKLKGRPFGSSFGCCILALSGHQPKILTGSVDGRLAIHGTDRPDLVGARASQGCLRARDRDVRWLMRTVPVGTQLTIRR
ncbi:MAG TPA: L,D-transpeptidase [Solirubrobacteraceae bacterium]|nr:L,D-transpeptidase [Solirubrobacteraceae bacterium]